MSVSFLCPNTCGFAKVVAFELSKDISKTLEWSKGESSAKYKSRVLTEEYKQFKSVFAPVADNFNIEYTKFVQKLPSLKDAIQNWSRTKRDEKQKYLDTFIELTERS